MKEKLMHKYALSSQGAQDMIKAFISVTISDLILMIPVSLLYFLVKDYMEGNLAGRGGFYIAGVIITLVLIAISTYIQYNATFLSTYVESGVRRITLAEKLRKIPLSFFGKKDLSDLTSTIMADCAQMETASSHFIPELVGACISTAFVAIGLFFFDWRMAIAALWVLPISFIIVSCSGKVQRKLNEKQVALKMTCADGIQECLNSVPDGVGYPGYSSPGQVNNILNECYGSRYKLLQGIPDTGEYLLNSFPSEAPVTSEHADNEVNHTTKRREQSLYDAGNGFPESEECVNGIL